MNEPREPKAENRSQEQSDTEDQEVTNFNQNTDYDPGIPEEEEQDPFSAHNLAIQQFIYTARVYDVLLALLKETNVGVSHDIIELHSKGLLLGPSPAFNGVFLTDEMNDESAGSEDTSN